MTNSPPRQRPDARVAIVLAISIFVSGALAVRAGQSNGFDLHNYHLYNGWAFWTGRTQDVAAAQLQSYYNPLLSTAAYLLFLHALPWVSSLVLGLVQGANVVPLYCLARRLLPSHLQRGAPWFALAVAMVGAFGATQRGELGSSIGDNLISLPLLCAFALAFRAEPGRRTLFIAAAMAGASAGLKLTVAPFALGLVMALPFLDAPATWRVLVLGIVATGLGFLATNGFWMWRLWQEFGNPVHPLFGGVFGGEFAPPQSLRDLRFLPRSAVEWLAYPLVWAAGAPRRVSELWFLDLRVPLAFLCLPWLAWRMRAQKQILALVVALTSAYLAWLVLFGIYRYLLPLEMLAPLLIALALAQLTPVHARILVSMVLAFVLLATRGPNWGRLRHYGETYLSIDLPALPQLDRATIVLADAEPLSFLALGFPSSARFVRIGGNLLGPPSPPYGMDRLAAQRIASSDGPLYALLGDPNLPELNGTLVRQQLERTGECMPVHSNLRPQDAWLCPLRKYANLDDTSHSPGNANLLQPPP